MKNKRITLIPAVGLLLLVSWAPNTQKVIRVDKGQYSLVEQPGGATLGYSPKSGVKIIKVGRYFFKDLNRNGRLDPYEDWRLPFEARARDLAARLSYDEIAGLMLYSAHQQIPAPAQGYGASTYNGKPFSESGALPSDLSDVQKQFLKNDHLRAVLVTKVKSPETAAVWSNNLQAYVEGLDHGIPANNSSDPRNETSANAEYNYGAGGEISQWPTSLGMAATFDPALVNKFGKIAAREYRALGITTALSPQVDIASEPRWTRFTGTFGEGYKLSVAMAKAYIDGFQTSTGKDEIANGWGRASVVAMVKHWPGCGPEEAGRDSHYAYGKYAVYPGKNMEGMLKPFVDGAFKLDGPTKCAGSIMPSYPIAFGQGTGEVGSSYSKVLITDLLRKKYQFDGIVCTDWMITSDNADVPSFDGKDWGVSKLTVPERHYMILKAGVDQFGGNNDKEPVLEAFRMGIREYGKTVWDRRIRESARRLLLPMFRTGLFENPYLDPAETKKTVGNKDFMEAGYEAQVKSIVMLKNHGNVLPLKDSRLKVYIPQRHFPSVVDFFGNATRDYWADPVSRSLVEKYYQVVDNPGDADFSIVFIQGPMSGTGYDVKDRAAGGNGYVPISLQYNDYTAVDARVVSISGGDPHEVFANRSYKGKTVKTSNRDDLTLVLETKKKMGGRPVIVALSATRPVVVSEFEKAADALLVSFGTSNQPFLDLVSGKSEPSGLLPCQFPADMKTVEEQKEDVPRDMIPYVDADGHSYDYAFGMNWSGVIRDSRVQNYK